MWRSNFKHVRTCGPNEWTDDEILQGFEKKNSFENLTFVFVNRAACCKISWRVPPLFETVISSRLGLSTSSCENG